MGAAWSRLPEVEQLALANAALLRALDVLVADAELLATEIDRGALTDRGGAEALRLLACIIRTAGRGGLAAVGHA